MVPGDIHLPFFIDDVYSGFARSEGILTLHDDTLEIEYQTKDTVFGVVKSKPKSLHIPLKEILTFEYKRNLFVSRMKVGLRKLGLMGDFPKSEQNELVLKIKRKDKEMAKRLASTARLRISEIRLEQMDNELRGSEQW